MPSEAFFVGTRPWLKWGCSSFNAIYCWFSCITVTLSNMACWRLYHLFVSIHHTDTIKAKMAIYLSRLFLFMFQLNISWWSDRLKKCPWTYLPILLLVLELTCPSFYLYLYLNLLAHPGACVVLWASEDWPLPASRSTRSSLRSAERGEALCGLDARTTIDTAAQAGREGSIQSLKIMFSQSDCCLLLKPHC